MNCVVYKINVKALFDLKSAAILAVLFPKIDYPLAMVKN